MSLQDLLHPNFLVPAFVVTSLIHRMELSCYKIFEEKLSYSQDAFKDAQFWESYMNKLLSEGKLSKDDSEVLNVKQHAIEGYNSFADKSVPKFFLFSRPWFYLKAKKELSDLQEESENRLEELKAA